MVVASPEQYPDQTHFSMGRTSSGSSDGSFLIPTNKTSTIHAVEEANPIRTEKQTPTEAIIQAPTQYDKQDGLFNILSDDSVQRHDHVIITDSMAVVQCMKNRTIRSASCLPAMISLKHLNRRRRPSEHREMRWSLQSMTKWILLRLPPKCCYLRQRQALLQHS